MPDFQYNLLSVNKLCQDQQCTVSFTADKCYIQGHLMKRPLVLGSVRSGLYSVESGQKQHITEESTTCLSASNASRNNAEVWHLRLGHMPFNKMKLIVSDLIEPSNNDSICQVCPAAKQSRVSIPISSIKTTERFQMIHLDTWGLTRVRLIMDVLCF